ncbi:hypothetical protein ACWEIJ_24270 [Lentzea sp. NPDC004789]
MPIEQQQSGSVEPETQVFAKITTEEPTVPATPAAQAPARPRKSLTRRIARRILGPTLMTKK